MACKIRLKCKQVSRNFKLTVVMGDDDAEFYVAWNETCFRVNVIAHRRNLCITYGVYIRIDQAVFFKIADAKRDFSHSCIRKIELIA